jgi:hypothetical protein
LPERIKIKDKLRVELKAWKREDLMNDLNNLLESIDYEESPYWYQVTMSYTNGCGVGQSTMVVNIQKTGEKYVEH